MLRLSQNPFWQDFFKFIIIAAFIIVPVRAWVAQPFIVRGPSMEPTFYDTEYLIVDEFSYHFREPKRGEVIVFRYPEDPSKFFIKRVVGLPDETVEIRDNKVFITKDGNTMEELKEPYLTEALTTPNKTVEVGEGRYFVMGDNRLFSSDSRRWGFLPRELIIGRALVRLWPPTRLHFLPGAYEFSF